MKLLLGLCEIALLIWGMIVMAGVCMPWTLCAVAFLAMNIGAAVTETRVQVQLEKELYEKEDENE